MPWLDMPFGFGPGWQRRGGEAGVELARHHHGHRLGLAAGGDGTGFGAEVLDQRTQREIGRGAGTPQKKKSGVTRLLHPVNTARHKRPIDKFKRILPKPSPALYTRDARRISIDVRTHRSMRCRGRLRRDEDQILSSGRVC